MSGNQEIKRTALLISLLILVAHMHAQTQTDMNAAARSDFARADAELNKTYQAVLAKLRTPKSKSSRKRSEYGSRLVMRKRRVRPRRPKAARWRRQFVTKQ